MTPTPNAEAALVGDTYPAGRILAGRYRVLRALGEGGMGQVYACEHVAVGRKVAVKVLQPWLAQHPVADRLRTEARAASAAGHPNIVEVFDAGVLDDGRPYIAMEFLDGQTLLEFIEASQNVRTSVVAMLGSQIARALHAAHQAGIIHRDLKPENVMLIERDGQQVVKVVDFGIAFDVTESKRMTREGLSVGTPQYMAPEQVFGAAGTPAFDIYALGVLMFEMCTGEPPYDGIKTVDILEAKVNAVAPRLDAWRPDAPRWLVELIAECLQHDPNARPKTAREVAERLERGVAAVRSPATGAVETIHVPAAAPAAKRGPDSSRSWTPLLILGLGSFVGLGIAASTMASEPQVVMPGIARVPLVVIPHRLQAEALEAVPEVEVEVEAEAEALEAVPEDAAEVEIESPPKVRRSKLPEELPAIVAEPKPKHSTTSTASCDGVVERARSSRDKHLWGPVLEEVAKRHCWVNGAERDKLYIHALKELGRFETCAKAAKGTSDPEVQSWARLCEKRAAR